MTITISQVRTSTIDEAFAAGRRLVTVRDFLLEHADDVNRKLTTMDDTWTGDAADACRAQWGVMSADFQRVADGLSGARNAVVSNAELFVDLRSKLETKLSELLTPGTYEVADDGTVTVSSKGTLAESNGMTLTPDAGTSALKGLLTQLTGVRTALANALKLGFAVASVKPTDAGWMDANSASLTATLVNDVPAPGTDPTEVGKWWAMLTPAAQAFMLANRFDVMGNILNGLPATVRNQVNLNRLHRDMQQWKQYQLDAAVRNDKTTYDYMTNLINEGNAILNNIAYASQYLPGVPVLLMNYRPDGSQPGAGAVGIAIGDPDNAGDVTVFQPGTGHSLLSPDFAKRPNDDGSPPGGDPGRAVGLYQQILSTAPGGSHSVIVNLSALQPPDLATDATHDSWAEAAAVPTAQDINGYFATNPNALHTVIGHSYGSYTIGLATQHGLTGVDNYVMVGSPGTGVQTASDLGADNQVFAAANAYDPIVAAEARFTPDPWSPLNVGQAAVTSPDYGATQFNADGPGGHGAYFEPGSAGLQNMALIATGDYGDVSAPGGPSATAQMFGNGTGGGPNLPLVGTTLLSAGMLPVFVYVAAG